MYLASVAFSLHMNEVHAWPSLPLALVKRPALYVVLDASLTVETLYPQPLGRALSQPDFLE